MYPHIYEDERAREMEGAATERQMGCSPLCRMISGVIMKCNGRKGRRRNEKLDYAMAYPPAQTCYMRPTALTVTCTTSNHPANAHAIPVQPPQVHGSLLATPFAPTAGAPTRAGGKPRKHKKSKHVRFTPAGPVPAGPAAPPPHEAHTYQHAAAAGTSTDAASADHHHQHHQAAVSERYSPAPHGHGYGYGRYAASPLTRWEMLGDAGTPRRHEYFSGEYGWYYPTPVREGIYSMATDTNRLTTIFSEENPNACTIV